MIEMGPLAAENVDDNFLLLLILLLVLLLTMVSSIFRSSVKHPLRGQSVFRQSMTVIEFNHSAISSSVSGMLLLSLLDDDDDDNEEREAAELEQDDLVDVVEVERAWVERMFANDWRARRTLLM